MISKGICAILLKVIFVSKTVAIIFMRLGLPEDVAELGIASLPSLKKH